MKLEDIDLAETGIEATVTGLTYFGHQQMVTLSLADETTVRARWRPGVTVSTGQQVHIRAGGNIHAFPRE